MKNSSTNKTKGRIAEELFAKKFEDNILRKAFLHEDTQFHYDYIMKGGVSVDVKSENKGDYIRVETMRRWEAIKWKYPQGIVPAKEKLGWVYGKADWIAYQVGEDCFEFINRQALVDFIEENPSLMRPLNYQEGSQVCYIHRKLLAGLRDNHQMFIV